MMVIGGQCPAAKWKWEGTQSQRRGDVGTYFETESLWASVNKAARISSRRCKSFRIEDHSRCTFVHNLDIDSGSIKLFVLILSNVLPPRRPDRQTDICRLCRELLSCSWFGEELLSLLILDLIFYLFPLLRIVSPSRASLHLLIVYTTHIMTFGFHIGSRTTCAQISYISIFFIFSLVSLFTLS